MEKEENIIRISVRTLVEFLLRGGSLDTQAGASSEAAMLEGARIHRRLQKKAGGGYQAEVPLRMDVPVGQAVLRLEGRADGIFFMKNTDPEDPETENGSSSLWTIDEIKTVFRGLGSMKAPVEVHLAQARCYAYMYACRENLDRIRIRMTYCSQATGDVRYFYEETSFEALEVWFGELIKAYEPWINLRLSFDEARSSTIRDMVFPFPYREGQYELAAGVYRTIVHGKKLFLQAPTGTGKTMAVLFPALKAIGTKKAERIFYLTAKGVTGAVAKEALSLLHKRGLSVRSLSLVSKERACPCAEVDCRPEVCTRADGHFDRVNDALRELLQGASEGAPMTDQVVAECARRHNVCPYALSLDAAEFADVIICDYNYAFHPQARLTRFFDGRTNSILLIDEAHNLLERGRDMYSAQLSYSQVRRFRRSVKNVWPRLWKKMKNLVRVLRELEKEAAQDDRRITVFNDWTPLETEAKSPADLSEKMSTNVNADAAAAGAVNADAAYAGAGAGAAAVTAAAGAANAGTVALDAAAAGPAGAGAIAANEAVPDDAMPVRRAQLYYAVEEVRDQIQWILEQENRSTALYGEAQGFAGGADSAMDSAADSAMDPAAESALASAVDVTAESALDSAVESASNRSDNLSGGRGTKAGDEPAGLQELLEFYFGLSHFCQMLRELDAHYIVYGEKGSGSRAGKGFSIREGSGGARAGNSHGEFTVHLYCADPSGHLLECMKGLTSAIFFSATFLPIQYYKSLLGGKAEDFEMYARSSFSPERRKVVIVRDVTSRYRDRGEETYTRIARSIGQIVACRPGNYMVYFPSYAFLESVLDAFRRVCRPEELLLPGQRDSDCAVGGGNAADSEDCAQRADTAEGSESTDIDNSGDISDRPVDIDGSSRVIVLAQKREMGDADRAAFLEAFEDVRGDRHLIGFCVLGGMFGEGIDLRRDRLIGSLIVGTGIPPVEPQRELLREYFSSWGKNGYDFAYRFPGMNKVLQAAGRVIRTADDIGIVVLMDGRFSEGANRELFPLEWGQPESVGSDKAAEIIRQFWETGTSL